MAVVNHILLYQSHLVLQNDFTTVLVIAIDVFADRQPSIYLLIAADFQEWMAHRSSSS